MIHFDSFQFNIKTKLCCLFCFIHLIEFCHSYLEIFQRYDAINKLLKDAEPDPTNKQQQVREFSLRSIIEYKYFISITCFWCHLLFYIASNNKNYWQKVQNFSPVCNRHLWDSHPKQKIWYQLNARRTYHSICLILKITAVIFERMNVNVNI